MFWSLLLSHLIADFPLQTDAMVQAKKTWSGLILHVMIHLLTMSVILFGILGADWRTGFPYVLLLSIFHLGIDTWKKIVAQYWPRWIIPGYLVDQALHLVSILFVATWYAHASGQPLFAIETPWIRYGIGYVLVTYFWFVSERVLVYRDKAYQQWVSAQLWPRMMSRAVLFSVVLVGWNVWGATAFIGGLSLSWFDLDGSYRWRATLIDVTVALGVILFDLTLLAQLRS